MQRNRSNFKRKLAKEALQIFIEQFGEDLMLQWSAYFLIFFLSNESGVNFLAQKLDTLSRQRHPPFHNRVMMALEIAQAMRYLHEQQPKVIHRDLKPSNIIFLDGSNHVRVVDFGHARFLDDSEMALTGETGKE